jgi:hypothetical protein
MIDVQLHHNEGYTWITDNGIYVKRIAFLDNKIRLFVREILHYFKEAENRENRESLLNRLDGIFSIIIIRKD